jgi:MOSC domain-containing protein YiiM
MRHRTVAELQPHLELLRASPKEFGTVELLVVRPGVGERRILETAGIDLATGMVGDTWATRPARGRRDGTPHPDKQVTVMNHRMVALLADQPEEQAMAGDQVYVDLDLSLDNLPIGSWLRLGTTTLEVTDPPHLGCPKFVKAFGSEAMQFVNSPEGRALRLRGLNARVVASGTVSVGDTVRVERPVSAEAG